MVARHTFERIVHEAEQIRAASAAMVSRAPMAGAGNNNGLIAEGKPLDPSSVVNSRLQVVTPGYLETARIAIKAGRDFTPQDTRDRTFVTIVNETLARTMWAGEDAIGKRFACCNLVPRAAPIQCGIK